MRVGWDDDDNRQEDEDGDGDEDEEEARDEETFRIKEVAKARKWQQELIQAAMTPSPAATVLHAALPSSSSSSSSSAPAHAGTKPKASDRKRFLETQRRQRGEHATLRKALGGWQAWHARRLRLRESLAAWGVANPARLQRRVLRSWRQQRQILGRRALHYSDLRSQRKCFLAWAGSSWEARRAAQIVELGEEGYVQLLEELARHLVAWRSLVGERRRYRRRLDMLSAKHALRVKRWALSAWSAQFAAGLALGRQGTLWGTLWTRACTL